MKLIRLYLLLFFVMAYAFNKVEAQGMNHQWLLGSYNFFQDPKGRMLFDSSNYTLVNENRKMVFRGTEGNISDANGNFLMSSNGVWIADATNDTMINGGGLNPGGITPNWPYGLPMVWNNAFIPFPGDSNKFILLHHSASAYNGVYSPVNDFFRTIVDMNLNGGLGGVILKNDLILHDTINGGIGLCKHANGRDWWVVVHKDSSDLVFKFLINDTGIVSITSQSLNYLPLPWGNFAQLSFSSDGRKFCTTTYNPVSLNSYLIVSDFDRCSGLFSNTQEIQLTINNYLLGLAFSPSGQFAYACSGNYIFQVDVNTFGVDTVAVYDGFISPIGSPCCATTFWNLYLAANGKIYVTSGSGVEHLHEINYPDSAGLACDVQQHAISLGYAQLRAVPNHPNYYLGCDTTSGCTCLTTGLTPGPSPMGEGSLKISPNPTNGNFKIVYMLPQSARGGKSGVFEVFDINGKRVFSYTLPPWSTLQNFSLPHLADGMYQCIIKSANQIATQKLIIIRE